MSSSEKWKGEERRSEERIRLSVDVEWDANDGTRSGTISDLNSGGCFILASGFFSVGETVRVRFPLSDRSTVEVVGEVANQVSDIGFALRFINLTQTQKDFLKNFAEIHESA